jgi:hypothetical protein
MLSQTMINRSIILGFMVLVGFSLAKSIYSGSIIGLVLAITSLGAGVYFLYLLARMKEQVEQEERI